jgi:hypothetical protein
MSSRRVGRRFIFANFAAKDAIRKPQIARRADRRAKENFGFPMRIGGNALSCLRETEPQIGFAK